MGQDAVAMPLEPQINQQISEQGNMHKRYSIAINLHQF